jgi:N-acetylmuramoyl-L-alanine amidase
VARAGVLVWGLACCNPIDSCSSGPGSRPEVAPAIDAGAVARARDLAEDRAPLSDRAEAATLAEDEEASALREGGGVRASQHLAIAAGLRERLWRVFGQRGDGEHALALYRAAAHDVRAAGACDSAIRGARLEGDLTGDATAAYAALYRVQRRFEQAAEADAGGATACESRIERTLDRFAAFRPAQRALEAIDEALQGAGAMAPSASPDAGAEGALQPARIARVETWASRDSARVVVVLDRPASYRISDESVAGTNLPRTLVDLDGVDPGAAAPDAAPSGIVTRVHTEATSTGSRVALDFDGRAWRRVFYMREPYRIVIDVARHPPNGTERAPRDVSRVVLDAGHGGRDTGAVGSDGTVEKEVTLDVAHRAARILGAQGIDVLLTRDDDHYVSLEERAARANAFGADLFVSVHCNASEIRSRRGVETYVLDTSRDEVAARVAARENQTTPEATAEVARMLSGMRLADQNQRSTRFARLLARSALATLRMKYRDTVDGGVHPAGFYVLVGARMPSVLFESSYISNPVDEERLASDDYRQLLADAIANAVKAYREGR